MWGGTPAGLEFVAFLPQNLTCGGNNFDDFAENEITQFQQRTNEPTDQETNKQTRRVAIAPGGVVEKRPVMTSEQVLVAWVPE